MRGVFVGCVCLAVLGSACRPSDQREYTLQGQVLSVAENRRQADLQILHERGGSKDLEGGFIEVKAAKAKSATRRIVKIQPCLDAWLRPFTKESGKVVSSWTHFDALKRRSYRRAGLLEWPLDRG